MYMLNMTVLLYRERNDAVVKLINISSHIVIFCA